MLKTKKQVSPLSKPLLYDTFSLQSPAKQLKSTANPSSPLTATPLLSRKDSKPQEAELSNDNHMFDILFKPLTNFEQKYKEIAGIVYISLAVLLSAFLIWMKNMWSTNVPNFEVFLIAILVASSINYFSIKNSISLSGPTDTKTSSIVKQLFALSIGVIILFWHGSQFLQAPFVQGIFYSACFIVILLEATFLSHDYTVTEIILGLGAYIGILLTLIKPNVFGNEDYQGQNILSLFYGIVVISLSAISLAVVLLKVKMVQETSFSVINYNLMIIMLAFLGIRLIMFETFIPTFLQCCVIFIIGGVISLIVVLVIRSIQIECAGKVSLYGFLYPGVKTLINYRFQAEERLAGLGCIMVLICLGTHAFVRGRRKFDKKNETEAVVMLEMTDMSIDGYNRSLDKL